MLLLVMHLTAVALLTLAVPVTPSRAQAPGYVQVKLLKAGLVLGAGGGSGVVTYRGRDYPFRVSGLSLGFTAGASFIRLKGWAWGIRQISDFAGTYSSVGSGGALIGGIGGVQLTNGKGVRIALSGPRAGVELAGNLGQITITLKE
ncbi:hypothetical protein [Tardiphaga sp. 709]|uniref:hypothetical protein n=1 Tax=Tardiphaga sp. 709 TaxID=3076039 RepID=UPI0028F10BC6|nr:hypothetical protein [Tardiphaga sp. 709]WNV07795.1 hypothetical protein RSO67_20040 [Tardiphaga sp. 709]